MIISVSIVAKSGMVLFDLQRSQSKLLQPRITAAVITALSERSMDLLGSSLRHIEMDGVAVSIAASSFHDQDYISTRCFVLHDPLLGTSPGSAVAEALLNLFTTRCARPQEAAPLQSGAYTHFAEHLHNVNMAASEILAKKLNCRLRHEISWMFLYHAQSWQLLFVTDEADPFTILGQLTTLEDARKGLTNKPLFIGKEIQHVTLQLCGKSLCLAVGASKALSPSALADVLRTCHHISLTSALTFS